MNGFQAASPETLRLIRQNLRSGLDRVAESLDDGTFHTCGPKGSAPPAQSGRLTLALLDSLDAELKRREEETMTDSPNPNTPEPCTTWSRRLRHFSINLRSANVGGREGTTLCNADAYDQENRNAWMVSFGSTKRVVVEGLPPCKKCAKKAGV